MISTVNCCLKQRHRSHPVITHTHTHTRAHTHTRTHARTHTHKHTHARMHAPTHTHTHTHTRTHARTTHTHTYTHTHARTHAHTHTHSPTAYTQLANVRGGDPHVKLNPDREGERRAGVTQVVGGRTVHLADIPVYHGRFDPRIPVTPNANVHEHVSVVVANVDYKPAASG